VVRQGKDGAVVENLQGIPVRWIVRATEQMNGSRPRLALIDNAWNRNITGWCGCLPPIREIATEQHARQPHRDESW
jgi:hypothetical protein